MAARTNVRISKAPKGEPIAAAVELENDLVEMDELPMPTKLKIGPFIHQVRPMDPIKSISMNRIGEYDTLRLAIEIYPDMPAQRRAETLMHELFHGLWHVTGLRNDEENDEERAVTVLSMAMVGVFRDNPEFIAWALQSLGDD